MRVLVTGGAGFIGSNLAVGLARAGHQVHLLDNLSRQGSAENLRRLLGHPDVSSRISFHELDVRDRAGCGRLLASERVDAVAHLAAQVAVTTSILNPLGDFDVNAAGTLSVLEAVRRHAPDAQFLFTSTNKVYGTLESLEVDRMPTRYVLRDLPDGVGEDYPTQPATPYGCSKLAADCYVHDYAGTYGLRTTVLRMSCVYGNWQYGTTDQGWVSWFAKSALRGDAITVYGDGLQVRDLLHVTDLVDALIDLLSTGRGVGQTFNVGGGPEFSLSVWAEFGDVLEQLLGRTMTIEYRDRRHGDQSVYISDIRKLSSHLSWKPRISPVDGLADMLDWLRTLQL